jgi:dihydrofolate synthase/folylpolyglutamate synthase
LLQVELPGRFQVLPGRPLVILDVAHNPHGARGLAASLKAMPPTGKTTAVFAMLADKDIAGVIEPLRELVDHWLVAGLPVPRGAGADQVLGKLAQAGLAGRGEACASVAEAYDRACRESGENDKILIFGSFYTVAEILKLQAARKKHGK